MKLRESEPCYVISIAARMVGVHAQTLRYYEKLGLVGPSRSQGNIRLYSQQDIARLRHIKTLMDDLGVNLAGVEVILRLMEHMTEMQQHLEELQSEIKYLKGSDIVVEVREASDSTGLAEEER